MTAKMNFINGVWVPARSGKTRKIINPATSEVLAEVADSGVEDTRSRLQRNLSMAPVSGDACPIPREAKSSTRLLMRSRGFQMSCAGLSP